jgi:hypothetical protein
METDGPDGGRFGLEAELLIRVESGEGSGFPECRHWRDFEFFLMFESRMGRCREDGGTAVDGRGPDWYVV